MCSKAAFNVAISSTITPSTRERQKSFFGTFVVGEQIGKGTSSVASKIQFKNAPTSPCNIPQTLRQHFMKKFLWFEALGMPGVRSRGMLGFSYIQRNFRGNGSAPPKNSLHHQELQSDHHWITSCWTMFARQDLGPLLKVSLFVSYMKNPPNSRRLRV